MKNWIVLILFTGILIGSQSCEKTEPNYMNSVPEGIKLLKQVNTYYDDHVIVDTFYYDAYYELSCLERRNGEYVNRFYFTNKKLQERAISINVNGSYVSYDISYMTDGKLSISNDTTAYLFSGHESGYYKHLSYLSREPFEEWNENYVCEYNWDNGNLSSACVNRVVTHFNYDDKSNPMAGYVIWGFFYDDLFIGTNNNRFEEGYQYEYNEKGYPVRLTTPEYQREYLYY